jgi:hypothetical protein
MKRIIFLDVDGVLNGRNYYLTKSYTNAKQKDNWDMVIQVCRKNLFWVGLLCRITNSKVVLSSSWRYGWNTDGTVNNNHEMGLVDKLFKKYGVNIISITPSGKLSLKEEHPLNEDKLQKWCNREAFNGLEQVREREFILNYCRGTQILKWIEDNKYKGKYLILEDDYCDVEFYKELEPRIIITSFYGEKFGFRLKHFLISLLKMIFWRKDGVRFTKSHN